MLVHGNGIEMWVNTKTRIIETAYLIDQGTSFAVTIQLLQLGHWGLALDRQDGRVKTIVGLFAAGRKVGADDGKGISAGIGAETTGDFLLEIGHVPVAFGLVVVEGSAQVGEESQEGPRCGARAVAE